MEFRRADAGRARRTSGWSRRHEREIVPLLHRRGRLRGGRRTSCSTTSGTTPAARTRTCSRTPTGRAARGRWSSTTTGTARRPAGSGTRSPTRSRTRTASKRLERRTLAEGLGLADGPADDRWLAFREQRTSLEYLRSVAEIRERGLHVPCTRTRRACSGSCASCTTAPTSGAGWPSGWAGAGVPSLEEALREHAAGARPRRRCGAMIDDPDAGWRAERRGGGSGRGDRARPATRPPSWT